MKGNELESSVFKDSSEFTRRNELPGCFLYLYMKTT